MSTYTATIAWERGGAAFTDNKYSRAHKWIFDGGATVPASSSPAVVKVPLSDPAAVDPEEAFVASLSSCHMLWFLSLAARKGFTIDAYVDRAVGYLERNDEGRMAMTRVVLRPAITFSGSAPTADELRELHDRSHHECFIANSVKTVVSVEAA
jgi:organic hydroperoxide reductase OsmC/OhrA